MPPTARVSALVQFYYQTGGLETWNRTDNWLQGDPCENDWYGVTCCLDTHPEYDTLDGYCHVANYKTSGNTSRVLPFNYRHELAELSEISVDASQVVEAERRRRLLEDDLARLDDLLLHVDGQIDWPPSPV